MKPNIYMGSKGLRKKNRGGTSHESEIVEEKTIVGKDNIYIYIYIT